MKRTEQAEAAGVLKALTKGWDLVDSSPEVDFLIFVSEDREELDFYPKKSFVQMMERSGLIENLDKEGSSVRRPYTSYESDGSVWREITEAGPIVFRYRITPKGQKFLRDAPKLIGKPVRPLRVATSPAEIPSKPLKVMTYDRQAIQKLVDAFVQKARAQIKAVFSSNNGGAPSAPSTRGLVCGPKLWRALEPRARRNDLRPAVALLSLTHSIVGGKEKNTARLLEDQPISTPDEVWLFWKTLRETYEIDKPPAIRRAESAEALAYPRQEEIVSDDFPSPDLSSLAVMFIVEADKSKFMVLVKSMPDADLRHFGPEVSWVELVGSPDKQE